MLHFFFINSNVITLSWISTTLKKSYVKLAHFCWFLQDKFGTNKRTVHIHFFLSLLFCSYVKSTSALILAERQLSQKPRRQKFHFQLWLRNGITNGAPHLRCLRHLSQSNVKSMPISLSLNLHLKERNEAIF